MYYNVERALKWYFSYKAIEITEMGYSKVVTAV